MLLLSNVSVSNGDQTSISCLKSIKDSIQDPHSYLESWSFKNNSQRSISLFHGISCWNANDDKLTGPVPNFLHANISAEYYANNKGLCGSPLKPCKVDSNLIEDDLLSDGIITSFSVGWAFGFSWFVAGFFLGIPSVSVVITSMCKRNKGEGLEATEICNTN